MAVQFCPLQLIEAITMERNVDKLIKIPGELTSAATNHVVAAARDIYDYNWSEYQHIINKRLKDDIDEIDPISLEFISIVCN